MVGIAYPTVRQIPAWEECSIGVGGCPQGSGLTHPSQEGMRVYSSLRMSSTRRIETIISIVTASSTIALAAARGYCKLPI